VGRSQDQKKKALRQNKGLHGAVAKDNVKGATRSVKVRAMTVPNRGRGRTREKFRDIPFTKGEDYEKVFKEQRGPCSQSSPRKFISENGDHRERRVAE